MWVLLIHVSSMLRELPSNWPNFVKFLAANSKRFRLVCLHVKKNNEISRWCSSDWNGRLHWIPYSSPFFFQSLRGLRKGRRLETVYHSRQIDRICIEIAGTSSCVFVEIRRLEFNLRRSSIVRQLERKLVWRRGEITRKRFQLLSFSDCNWKKGG